MSKPVIAYKHLPERYGLDLLTGSWSDEERLVDRKRTAAATLGASTSFEVVGCADENVDVMIMVYPYLVPTTYLKLEWSDNGTDWYYPPGVGQITNIKSTPDGHVGVLEWAAMEAARWRWTLTNILGLKEVCLSKKLEWPVDPTRPGGGPYEKEPNVEHVLTLGGADRFLVKGQARQRRQYKVTNWPESHLNQLLQFYNNEWVAETDPTGGDHLPGGWAGRNPFWFKDHLGAWMLGRLAAPLNIQEEAPGIYSFDFDFVETVD